MSSKTQLINGVLDTLRGALGTGEDPPKSNHNFITVWYNKHVKKIGDGPWCEMTNTWSAWTSGCEELVPGEAYTVYATRDAKNEVKGTKWIYGTKGMKAGDRVYYDWSGKKGNSELVDHTGTIEKIDGDGTFYVLEGNSTGNKLVRQRRDNTYVVGYVRLGWDRIATAPVPKPKPPVKKPKTDPIFVAKLQNLLELTENGNWGAATDLRAKRMRTAARAKVGYPRRIRKPFDVEKVQSIIDTKVDGVWGPSSQASLVHWVRSFQHLVGVTVDGDWGAKTDNAFLKVRVQNHNNF